MVVHYSDKEAIKLAMLGVAVAIIVSLAGLLVGASINDSLALRVNQIPKHSKVASIDEAPAATPYYATNLVSELNSIIESDYPSVAVSVVDIDNNQTYDAGKTEQLYKAASTAKVLTAIAYMHQVDQGNASLDTYIYEIQARELLRAMIEDSNNDAWHILREYIGDQEIQNYAQSLGMSAFYGYDYNVMTAQDDARMLDKLARGELISNQLRDVLYGFMSNTNERGLIPAALPEGAVAYNKYGTLFGNLHDSSIIKYQGHTITLVIYTNTYTDIVDDYAARASLIHALTSAVSNKLLTNASGQ